MLKRMILSPWKALPVVFLLFLFALPAHPAMAAGSAPSSDVLVQCDSSGTVTSNTAISGVKLPIVPDTSGIFYLISVDAAIFSGSGSSFGTDVTEQDGFTSTDLQIGLGAVTNYDTGTIYEVKYRGHYGLVGEAGQEIAEGWQDSGLYFEAQAPAPSAAPALTITSTVPGSVAASTQITATPSGSDILAVEVSASSITTPNVGDAAPSGSGVTNPYASGSNITGVDATTNKYVGVYELNASGTTVVKFTLVTLTSGEINNAAPALTITSTVPGSVAASTQITATPSGSDILAVEVSASSITTPNVGDAAPSGSGVTNPYASGSNITGVDATTNKYVGVYELNASGTTVVKFTLVTLTSGEINNTVTATVSFSPGDGSTIAPSSTVQISTSASLSVAQAVYYTTNGLAPSLASFRSATQPFNVTAPSTPGTFSVEAAVYDTGTSGTGWGPVNMATYTVSSPAAASLTVTAPAAGMSWQAGATQDITWTYTGNPGDSVEIDLLEGGNPNSVIAASTSTSSGSYSWAIPPVQAPASDYQVRITSSSCNATSGEFSITAAPSGNGLTISPSGNTFTNSVDVTINDSSLGVGQSVYYSTSGDPETFSHSYAYPLPYYLTVSVSETVSARVYDYEAGWENPLASGSYTIGTAFTSRQNDSVANDTSTLGLTGISCTSSDSNVATADLTSNPGYVTITSVGQGSATITVSDASNHQATIVITVAADGTITIGAITKYVSSTVPVTGVILNAHTLNLTVGGSDATLTATVAPSDATDRSVTWSSRDNSVATVSGGVVSPVAAGTATITATTNDGGKTDVCAVTVSTPVTVSTGNSTVSVNSTPVQVTAPQGVNGTLQTTPSNGRVTLPQVTVNATTSQGAAVNVTIPGGTQVTGSSSWNGTINLPQSVTDVSVPAPSGKTTSVSEAVAIGISNASLSFNPPVEIVLPGQGGKEAGWMLNGSFTPIPELNSQPTDASAAVTALNSIGQTQANNGDGYYSAGNNMVIWTYHFTTFVAYTESTVNSGGGGGGAPPALAATTTSLAAGTVGQPYEETITTNNEGTAPYTFTVTSGSLPSGLTLDASTGVISGMPTEAGTYAFTVTVKDANSNSASESYDLTVNAATITQPSTSTPSTEQVTLSDITGNWAQANIEKLVSMGAITGYPNGTFRPDNDITRAEFVTVLVKALKLAPKTGPLFADTQRNWAQGYVSTAAAYGIVSGYDASHFGPNELITREQMTAMVVRAAKLAPVSGELTFKDAALIDGWATQDVLTGVKDGIIHGYPDGTFRPLNYATRAEAATVIAGLLK